jgi:2-iminobutanoate/2-iminopropanoate deaminase
MRKLLNRRDFLVAGSAGLAATAGGLELFSFPLSANAQGNRSVAVGRGSFVRVDADADLMFLAGTTALDLYHLHPHVPYEIIVPPDIVGQTHMCMRNIKEVLDDQGLNWTNVVKVNRFQTDLDESDEIETVMAEYFGYWDWWPAMTAMQIRNLSSEPTRLEIEVVAVAPRGA